MSNNITRMQTLEQRRAAAALSSIDSVVGKNYDREYRSLVRSFPAYVLTNGLAPALAFLKSKGGPEHEELYRQLSDWVPKELGLSSGELLDVILQQNSYAYMRTTREALAFVVWLKRFAEAKIQSKQAEEQV